MKTFYDRTDKIFELMARLSELVKTATGTNSLAAKSLELDRRGNCLTFAGVLREQLDETAGISRQIESELIEESYAPIIPDPNGRRPEVRYRIDGDSPFVDEIGKAMEALDGDTRVHRIHLFGKWFPEVGPEGGAMKGQYYGGAEARLIGDGQGGAHRLILQPEGDESFEDCKSLETGPEAYAIVSVYGYNIKDMTK